MCLRTFSGTDKKREIELSIILSLCAGIPKTRIRVSIVRLS